MEWSRLYANLPSQERVLRAEEAAPGSGWLLVQSICYCTHVESDGFIPDLQAPLFGCLSLPACTAALVEQKIWLPEDGGWVLDPVLWSKVTPVIGEAS